MQEIWVDIKDYEGLYQVSNLGRVKALEKVIIRKKCGIRRYPEIIRKLVPDKDGYLSVLLCANNKVKTFKVHRLVATAFISNPENKPTINHKNGIKTDNRVENLEWATNKEQIVHARRAGLMNTNQYGKNNPMWNRKGKDSPFAKPIYQIDIVTNKIIKEFPSLTDAAISLNKHSGHISQVCQGKRNSAYGYKWKYKKERI